MAKWKLAAMMLILFALVTGCDGGFNPFDYNLFTDAGVAAPVVTAPAQAAADQDTAAQSTSLSTMRADLASPAYLAELTAPANADTLTAVTTYLEDVYSQTVTEETAPVVQEAAALYADLALTTTSGTLVVDKVVESLVGGKLDLTVTVDPSLSGEEKDAEERKQTAEKVASLINSMLPVSMLPETADSTEAFTTMIAGMVSANEAYSALTATITDPATAAVSDNIIIGDVAQKALVSYVVANAVELWIPETVVPDPVTGQYEPEVITDAATGLYAFLQDPTDAALQPTGTLSIDLDGPGFTGITNLLAVAGITLPF